MVFFLLLTQCFRDICISFFFLSIFFFSWPSILSVAGISYMKRLEGIIFENDSWNEIVYYFCWNVLMANYVEIVKFLSACWAPCITVNTFHITISFPPTFPSFILYCSLVCLTNVLIIAIIVLTSTSLENLITNNHEIHIHTSIKMKVAACYWFQYQGKKRIQQFNSTFFKAKRQIFRFRLRWTGPRDVTLCEAIRNRKQWFEKKCFAKFNRK